MSNLTGKTFGSLKVVGIKGVCRDNTFWLCSCVCGKTITFKGSDLVSGTKVSCGCRPNPIKLNPLTGRRFGEKSAPRKTAAEPKKNAGPISRFFSGIVSKIKRLRG